MQAPDFSLESTKGSTRRLGEFTGAVVILVYEDRHSAEQNASFKNDLAERAKTSDLSREVTLLAIANLEGFKFWPAERFARDAVLAASKQFGIEILIHWNGDVARAYRFAPRTSHVVIVGRDGALCFHHAGPLDGAEREAFYRALAEVVAIEPLRTGAKRTSGSPMVSDR